MIVRKASADDIDTLVKLRFDYIREEIVREEKKPMSSAEEEDLTLKLKNYFQKWIDNGGFAAFMAEECGKVVSTAFLSIVERPPRNAFTSYLVGTVFNVFTYPEHRRKGAATKVITALLDEARKLDIAVVDLQATPDGKPLYDKLGFYVSSFTAMKIKIEEERS